jgi:hypothetical protein
VGVGAVRGEARGFLGVGAGAELMGFRRPGSGVPAIGRGARLRGAREQGHRAGGVFGGQGWESTGCRLAGRLPGLVGRVGSEDSGGA